MEYRLPEPNYCNSREWDWPFEMFNLDPEELFTTLHDRFNIHKLPLQDLMTFHRDVCESAHSSASLEEFYSQMEERKAERIKEMMLLCFDPKTGEVMTKPGTLNDPMFERGFNGFVRDQRKKVEDRRRASKEILERWRKKQAAAKHVAAAAEAMEAASQKSSHLAPSSYTPSSKSRPSSHSRRHDAATHLSTTESSMARKSGSDEDVQGPERKRWRATSEIFRGDNDVEWNVAWHDKLEVEEPMLMMKNKRTIYSSDREEDSEYMQDPRIHPQSVYEQLLEEGCQDLAQTQIPPPGSYYSPDSYRTREEEEEEERGGGGYMKETQISPQKDMEGPALNDATTEAANAKK
ncbi:hypothetical protein V8C37DRAFT_419605 [Trichoderma ceciliae]